MLVMGLLVVVLVAGAVAIRSRASGHSPVSTEPSSPSPERRLWEIWKQLGWGERVTMLALVIGVVGAVSFALYGLVLLVW